MHPCAEASATRAGSLPDFEAGCDALRQLEQAGLAPAVARLSDEEETRYALALAGRAGVVAPRSAARAAAC